jgi:lipopolysaccharide/colanic/teichoic acid biosynthesis glycosyltransferase
MMRENMVLKQNRILKRITDIVIAILGLCVLSPVMIIVAAIVKWDSPGEVFFQGTRVGLKGKTFRIYKFRTMYDGKTRGSAISVKDDPRITRAGRVLRKLKLDELPQLLNVLSGEMSFVGPRPEDPKYVSIYNLEQRQLLDVRPGITSPGSILFKDEASYLKGDDWEQVYCSNILPAKLRCDLDYINSASWWSDLAVIAQTMGILLKKDQSKSFQHKTTGNSRS